MKALILDTETTGKDATTDQPVEIAYLEIDDGMEKRAIDVEVARLSPEFNQFYCVTGQFEQRYKPDVPISFGAMSTHHIMEDDLDGMPPPQDFVFPADVQYVIGHNVDFDWNILRKPGANVKLIDTLALARVLWSDDDSHTQSACMYRIDRGFARQMTSRAHAAAIDVQICLNILDFICAKMGIHSFERLHELSERARIPSVIRFGKYNGKNIVDEVPQDYKDWCFKQGSFDPYLIKAMKGERGLVLEAVLTEAGATQ